MLSNFKYGFTVIFSQNLEDLQYLSTIDFIILVYSTVAVFSFILFIYVNPSKLPPHCPIKHHGVCGVRLSGINNTAEIDSTVSLTPRSPQTPNGTFRKTILHYYLLYMNK